MFADCTETVWVAGEDSARLVSRKLVSMLLGSQRVDLILGRDPCKSSENHLCNSFAFGVPFQPRDPRPMDSPRIHLRPPRTGRFTVQRISEACQTLPCHFAHLDDHTFVLRLRNCFVNGASASKRSWGPGSMDPLSR